MDEDQFEEEIGRTAILLLAKKIVSRLFPDYSTVNDDAVGMIVDDSETQIDIIFICWLCINWFDFNMLLTKKKTCYESKKREIGGKIQSW